MPISSCSTSRRSPFTPLNDALRQLVLGSTTLAVDSALVGGRWVSSRRPPDRASTRMRSSPRPASSAPGSSPATTMPSSSVAQLLAGVRAGWLEAMRTDVGVERKLAPG